MQQPKVVKGAFPRKTVIANGHKDSVVQIKSTELDRLFVLEEITPCE